MVIKSRQKLGKYRIEKKLGVGGFANVYQAMDTVEGIRVALKIPHEQLLTAEMLDDFRKEVRISAKLKHPHILPLKTADFIDDLFVIAYPLGERTLAERLHSRITIATALDFAEQMLEATAYAHEQRVIHCDIKPDNLILFPDGKLMLTDFGIAKVAIRTVRASGSGTLGYCAPEQAMGKPGFPSDVFAIGLVIYRMLTGQLPEWPFTWPPVGYQRLRARAHPDLIDLVRRSIDIDPRKRFAHAGAMLAALTRIKPRALKYKANLPATTNTKRGTRDWRTIRRRQFQQQFGKQLQTKFACSQCEGPVSEVMTTCPWCGVDRRIHRDGTQFPQECPRCHRGLKLDWCYCPWCFGSGFDVDTNRQYTDVRYTARCTNTQCSRRQLMPFMRYCPWCRRKVRRRWRIEDVPDKCPSCEWGVLPEYWSFCPWCAKSLGGK